MDVRYRISHLGDDVELTDEMLDCEINNPILFWFYMRELNYFEELGLLHRRRVVNTKTLELMLGTIIRERWEMWNPTVLALQHRDNDDTYYENFARLGTLLERKDNRRRRRRKARRAVWHWLTNPQYPPP